MNQWCQRKSIYKSAIILFIGMAGGGWRLDQVNQGRKQVNNTNRVRDTYFFRNDSRCTYDQGDANSLFVQVTVVAWQS